MENNVQKGLRICSKPMNPASIGTPFSHKCGWSMKLWAQHPLDAHITYRNVIPLNQRALILTWLVLLGYRADVMSAFLVSWQ